MVTSTPNPPISVEDFSRIHGVIRGVLAGLEIGASSINTSCVFFAFAGAHLLQQKHGLQASPAAGAAFIAVSQRDVQLDILTFAKREPESEDWYSDTDAFHAWVHVAGEDGQQWIIDFTSPLYSDLIRQQQPSARPGFKAFMRPVSEMIHPNTLADDGRPGDFFMQKSEAHTTHLLQRVATSQQTGDLIGIASQWYAPAPSRIPEYLSIGSNDGRRHELRFRPPRLAGMWNS